MSLAGLRARTKLDDLLGKSKKADDAPPPKKDQPDPDDDGKGGKDTQVKKSSDKGAFGERAAYDKMKQKGHEPVGKTDGSYVDGQKGIDGVYKNANQPPDYIITDVKSGSSAKLDKGLADGTNQMDDDWVDKQWDGRFHL